MPPSFPSPASGGGDAAAQAGGREYTACLAQTHDGLRPISITMTLGRCSMRGPADAVTPAMSPSDISAPAKACAVGASSFARLAVTNTVTPELGESGMPAG